MSEAEGGLERTSRVVMNGSATKHGIVFDFRATKGGTVGSNDNQLGLARAQGLQSRLDAQTVLAALHDEGKARVDRLNRLFLYSDAN